jgi:hypothetical protein
LRRRPRVFDLPTFIGRWGAAVGSGGYGGRRWQGLERFEQLDVGIANIGAILGAARVGSRRLAARRAHHAWIVDGRRPNADKESAGVVEERGVFYAIRALWPTPEHEDVPSDHPRLGLTDQSLRGVLRSIHARPVSSWPARL